MMIDEQNECVLYFNRYRSYYDIMIVLRHFTLIVIYVGQNVKN